MSVHVGGAENLQFAAKVGRVGESMMYKKYKYQPRREASALGHHVGAVSKLQASRIHSL